MENFAFGIWNGMTGIFLLIGHVFGHGQEFPIWDFARNGSMWYQFGFLVGASGPLFGFSLFS